MVIFHRVYMMFTMVVATHLSSHDDLCDLCQKAVRTPHPSDQQTFKVSLTIRYLYTLHVVHNVYICDTYRQNHISYYTYIYTKIHNHTNICIFWWISWRLRAASFPDCSVLVPMGQIFAPGQKCWLPEHLPRRPRPWWTQQRPVAKKPRSLFFGFSGCFVWKTHGKLMII